MEFLIIIVLFVGMMWLMTRGQRKQQAAANEFRSTLQTDQNVMTHSGFYGRIVDIDGDVVTLESTPGVETMWKRSAIAALADPPFAVDEDDEALDSTDSTDGPADEVSDDVAPAAGAPAAGSTTAGATVVPDDASSLLEPPPADGPVRDRPDDDDPRTPAS